MDFGHLDNLTGIELNLPPNHAETARELGKYKNTKVKPAIYVGGPVWADSGYVGTLYPKGTKSSKYLYEYCRQFNAIELNATHYRLPPLETVHQWRAVATAGFKFSPKVPQNKP